MAVTIKKPISKYYYSSQGQKWAVFGAGFFAAGTMTIIMVLLLISGITPRSMGNLVADKLAAVFPPQWQEFFIQLIGPLGKDLLFYGVLVGQVTVGGLLALLFGWLWPRIGDKPTLWRNIFILSTTFWLVLIFIGLPILDAGFIGLNLGSDQIIFLVTSFALFQVYGLAFGYLYLRLVPPKVDSSVVGTSDDDEIEIGSAPSRRRFVIGLSAFFVTALAAGIGVGAFRTKSTEYWGSLGSVVSGSAKLQGEVTPVGTFYNVSKNAFDPSVSVQGWTLEVNGMVNKTLSYDYNTIRQLPVINQAHTLTCISNPVGGQLIGNAEWKGTQLKTILETAGVGAGVKKLVFTCADGYTDSITINTALDPQTVLVWEMNGAPLEPSHGFPIRALIPNIYGMKNAKWIKQITLVDTEYEGFWQKQGWDNPAVIHTESTLTSLNNGAEVRSGERLTLQGFAFAGQRGIKKVEISTDGGQNWLEAQVKDGLGQNSWQLWHLDWTPNGSGKTARLVVRATDKTGALQTNNKAEPFPEGSSGWNTISVKVI